MSRARAVDRAIAVLSRTQEPDGSWKGDYGGPMFLVPAYVIGCQVMGHPLDLETRAGFERHLRMHQNSDGGWGLDVESKSHVFTSVLNYVALRLLGASESDSALVAARRWFLPWGGALASGSWGKFFLALLGLYDYRGLNPLQPELWLLPKALPLHPSRLWCHCRMVYLPMSWLYGKRHHVPLTPLLAQLRTEIYAEPYEGIDWPAARNKVAETDAYTPRGAVLRAVNAVLSGYERVFSPRLRQVALDEVLEQIRGEDEATHHICIGPINKILNAVVWHVARPGGPEASAHLSRLPDYLYRAADGVKVNGYNSSQLWDTTFAVQALAATGHAAAAQPVLERAARFIEANQVLEDSPHRERYDRHPSKGGWPFSTREHGWPISDCTAEGLKASLLLEPHGLSRVSDERLTHAVSLILSMQNRDGGWATYELQRGPRWLELLNPSDVFSTIMVDTSYVECTSACMQALAAWKRARPQADPAAVDAAIARGDRFLRRVQRVDGSWEGSWGVCFTYGAWFGVNGLLAAGAKVGDSALARAVGYLKAHQSFDGSFSETLESCRARLWVEGDKGHAVNTAWALMALAAAGQRGTEAVKLGVRWLLSHQGTDGTWPAEPIAGVFNRTCAIHYDAYLKIFPMWALAVCA